MALYWPDAKVALDIVDDPERIPFEGGDEYTVVRVTCNDLSNYDSFCHIMKRLSNLLGCDLPTDPDWQERNQTLHAMLANWSPLGQEGAALTAFSSEDYYTSRDASDYENIEILASSKDEADLMRAAARQDGKYVRRVSVWDGPVPKGSFEPIGEGIRMSTPEYMFFRKANQLSFARAVQLGNELCGRFRTSLTRYDAGDDYDYLTVTRTSTKSIRHYLRDAQGTKECKRARKVLSYVADEASSPMASYLHIRMCLPQSQGGYGLGKAKMSCVFEEGEALMPSAEGPYLAYDVAWPNKHVALQYVGKHKPTELQQRALEANGMRVVCVTDSDIQSPDLFDRKARKLAKWLGVSVPDETEKWRSARKRLCRQIPIPDYHDMRTTMKELVEHFSM